MHITARARATFIDTALRNVVMVPEQLTRMLKLISTQMTEALCLQA